MSQVFTITLNVCYLPLSLADPVQSYDFDRGSGSCWELERVPAQDLDRDPVPAHDLDTDPATDLDRDLGLAQDLDRD